jgi:hypothetical protein
MPPAPTVEEMIIEKYSKERYLARIV